MLIRAYIYSGVFAHSIMPLPRKQWFAFKSKLQKSGEYDENYRARATKRKHPDPVESDIPDKKAPKSAFAQPGDLPARITEVDIDDPTYAEVEGILSQVPESELAGDTGESNLMSFNGFGSQQDRDFFDESSSDSCLDTDEQIIGPREINPKVHVEGEDLLCREKLPDSPIPFFHSRGKSTREAWEIERAFRNYSISDGTRERMRIASIPETAGTVRDNTVILLKNEMPMFLNEWEIDPNETDVYENYYQNFNSLAIVIRALPDCNVTTVDIYNILIEFITDPFAIVCEKSDDNVIHWHMLWFTSRRSDNAKRALQKLFDGKSYQISIAVQTTKSMKHFARYMLKNPITLGISNHESLINYFAKLLMENPKPKSITDQFPNAMIKDIINAMRKYSKFTYNELVLCAPEVMQKYLHKPNIESIINNCKVFLMKPSDIDLTMNRVMNQADYIADIFPIWCFLDYQGLCPEDFIMDFFSVIMRAQDKINVLCLQGPSNTGKTTFIRPLTEIFNFGEVVAGGQFMFQNCLGKELLIWEEPLIGSDFAEMCKRVFEGMTTQVNVKFKAAQTLYRTPIIITTNKDVWHYCDQDEMAFRNRMYLHYFMKSGTIQAMKPSFIRRSYKAYCEWLTSISKYFSDSISNDTTGVTNSSENARSSESTGDRELCVDSELISSVCDPTSEGGCRSSIRISGRRRNNRRSSSSRNKDIECTERPRSPINNSSSIDDCIDKPGTSTGNTIGGGSNTKKRRAICSGGYTTTPGFRRLGLDWGRHSFTEGGIRSWNTEFVRTLQGHINELLRFKQRYSTLHKLYEKGEIFVQPGLDRTLFEPLNKQQWLSLISLGYFIAKACKAF